MTATNERSRRWRLLLGNAGQEAAPLSAEDFKLDQILSHLYGQPDDKKAGNLSASAPTVTRWLGDIREHFPKGVVQVMQKDAIERLNLTKLLLEPEMLEAVEANVHLLATLMSLSHMIPAKSKQQARAVVQKIVDELLQRLRLRTEQAIRGSLNRALRRRRPRHGDIDWQRTLRANLAHYQPEYKTVIPQRLIGFGRRQPSALKEVILCVDQSGSMASSVIYASIFAVVMACIPALRTQLIVFDTQIVDLTEKLQDPVDVLFGTQLGGGTDINKALAYCQQQTSKPQDTTMILITDLYEGGNSQQMLARAAEIKRQGVNLITLLALNDDGAPSYDKQHAQLFATLDIPTFACTPDAFPDLMAAALNGNDISTWAAQNNIATTRS